MPVKLFEVESLEDTRRFQSQLFVGRAVADFILKDSTMYVWGGRGEWVPYTKEYKIVKSKKEMKTQKL